MREVVTIKKWGRQAATRGRALYFGFVGSTPSLPNLSRMYESIPVNKNRHIKMQRSCMSAVEGRRLPSR